MRMDFPDINRAVSPPVDPAFQQKPPDLILLVAWE
jgi:hypothetical protein